jgi:hypothetical protein
MICVRIFNENLKVRRSGSSLIDDEPFRSEWAENNRSIEVLMHSFGLCGHEVDD